MCCIGSTYETPFTMHIHPDVWSFGRSDKQLIMMHEVSAVHTLIPNKYMEIAAQGDHMSLTEMKPALAGYIQELHIFK
jgi:hypothetical protein